MTLIKCRSCGSEITDNEDAEFCSKCGSPLEKLPCCPNCGKKINDFDAEFCSTCGTRVKEKNKTKKKCWNCGFELLDPNRPSCPKCTVLLDQSKLANKPSSNYDYKRNIIEIVKWGGVLIILLIVIFAISVIVNPSAYNQNLDTNMKYGTPIPTLSITQLKTQAITPSWDDLSRYNEKYIGKIVYYRGGIIQSQNTNNDYQFRIATLKSKYGGYSDDVIFVNYKGTRLLEGDVVDVWGTVNGLKTYTSVFGKEITIPEIDAIEINYIESSK
jgi:ribosomal protein L37E